MDPAIFTFLPMPLIESVAAMPFGWAIVPLALSFLTASTVALSLPGTLAPLSFLSGLLLGFGGILAVSLGAVVGSLFLFLATRRWLAEKMRVRFGKRLDGFGDHLERKGPIYIVGARLVGVPHLLVTAGCAAAPITARAFVAASLLGMLPAIVLATLAGSAF